jgi:hypothetical protein
VLLDRSLTSDWHCLMHGPYRVRLQPCYACCIGQNVCWPADTRHRICCVTDTCSGAIDASLETLPNKPHVCLAARSHNGFQVLFECAGSQAAGRARAQQRCHERYLVRLHRVPCPLGHLRVCTRV